MKTIIHATTVHPRGDTRIRLKEVKSLTEHLDAKVSLFVMDGLPDEAQDGYNVHSIGPKLPRQRNRIKVGIWRMYRALRNARPDIVHFHDPELIPIGLLLKLQGICVINDIHENTPEQIKGRSGFLFQIVLPTIIRLFEKIGAVAFDGLVCATPAIAEHFPARKTTLVQNFPLEGELISTDAVEYGNRPADFAFVGGITKNRGTEEMIDAIGLVSDADTRLHMAGRFTPESLETEVSTRQGWEKIVLHSWADRSTVATILGRARAGLVVYLPLPNHIAAQPNKLFEYMSASLPVIASDFPLWRQIVDGAKCGLLVDPADPNAIA